MAKFVSPRHPRLHVWGAGRFTAGQLEVTDVSAVAVLEALEATHGVQRVDEPAPVAPAAVQPARARKPRTAVTE